MGPFEAMYASGWQHPGIAWLGGACVLGAWARRRDFRPLFWFLLAEILLDAWFTGALSPLPSSSVWYSRASIAFVVLGDWRYFFLFERERRTGRAALAISVLWSCLLPLATAGVGLAAPNAFTNPRHAYLFWEVAFVLITALFALRVQRWAVPEDARWRARLLTTFVGGYYALWALADLLILADIRVGGLDVGYLLRLAPNVLYYVGFVAFAAALTREERATVTATGAPEIA